MTIKKLRQQLESCGWSTTQPHPEDDWLPYAWPPLDAEGRVTPEAARLHAELANQLGEMEDDDEGAPCCRIIETDAAEYAAPAGSTPRRFGCGRCGAMHTEPQESTR